MNTKDTIQKDTEAGHTPGPWSIGRNGEILAPDVGRTLHIAKVYAVNAGVFGACKEVDIANARLIAAAPELLEVCEKILRKWNPETGKALERVLGTFTINHLVDVVGKATGKT